MSSTDISHQKLFEIFMQLMRVGRIFNDLDNFTLKLDHGEKLYPSEIHVISAVGSGLANQVKILSKKFGITKGAVSQVVNKLSNKGYIKKESLGKETILSLTPKGRMAFDMQDELHKKIENYFVNYLNDESPEDIDSFLKILDKIEEFTVNFLSEEFQTSPL